MNAPDRLGELAAQACTEAGVSTSQGRFNEPVGAIEAFLRGMAEAFEVGGRRLSIYGMPFTQGPLPGWQDHQQAHPRNSDQT